jgi:hypothetical protein
MALEASPEEWRETAQSEGRRGESEDWKREDRGRTNEDWGWTSEDWGRTSEDWGRTSEDWGWTSEDRGQTNLDLLIGVSVFLITAGFVLATASGMSDPFVGGQEHPLVADRTTALLAEGMFATAGTPSALNETCTFGFFNDSMGEGTCAIPYDASESDLTARLGLSSRYSVNVTVRRNATGTPEPDVLCTDGESVGGCPDATRLAAGPTPPDSGSTFSASRGAYLAGKDVIVEVVLW